MKLINLKSKFAVAILSASVLFGVTAISSVRSSAQSRNDPFYNQNRDQDRDNGRRRRGRDWDGYGRWGGSYELRQTALNAGYNEGIKEGRKDRNKGKGFDFYSKNEFQKATKDYSSRLGDKELYRRYFRQAYENGYTDGYRGY